ncbi:hypothetical protein ABZ738_24045 [Micromonospora sp. NPDC047793]|uniref:hypothetical protein n=1 Tax=Micromonospora sp. NPDC047793 TaxID=3154342 RepID=UPI0033E93D75
MVPSLVLVAVAALGFAAGLFLFKVKSRWCRRCGSALNCPDCGRRRSRPYPGRTRSTGWL